MSEQEYGMHPPYRKKRILFGLLAVVIFVSIAVLMADIETNSPQFCASCHTMRPEFHTWQASSHNKLGCIECHRDEGLKGQLEFMVDLASMVESQVLKNYVTPIRLFSSINDERCFRCHNYTNETSASGDLVIPHQDHTSSKVRCASCHSGVAHGDIARRGITKKVGYEEWDSDQGLQQMAQELVQPDMDTCMSCHFRRRITMECSACHTDMYGPESHELADFGTNHGSWAREGLKDCNDCHGYEGLKKLEVKENTSLIKYTRDNTFCLSCHKKKPESHASGYFEGHGRSIAQGLKQKDNCYVCHDNNIPEITRVTNITCSECHPAKHGKDWQNSHMPRVLPGQKLSYECLGCHSSATCLACHYLPGYSDTNYSIPPAFDPNGEVPTDFFM